MSDIRARHSLFTPRFSCSKNDIYLNVNPEWNEWRRKWEPLEWTTRRRRHRKWIPIQIHSFLALKTHRGSWWSSSSHDLFHDDSKPEQNDISVYASLQSVFRQFIHALSMHVVVLFWDHCQNIFMQCRFSRFLPRLDFLFMHSWRQVLQCFHFLSFVYTQTTRREKEDRERLWLRWWFYFTIILILRSFICIWLRCQERQGGNPCSRDTIIRSSGRWLFRRYSLECSFSLISCIWNIKKRGREICISFARDPLSLVFSTLSLLSSPSHRFLHLSPFIWRDASPWVSLDSREDQIRST
jgi:hypothetical protein